MRIRSIALGSLLALTSVAVPPLPRARAQGAALSADRVSAQGRQSAELRVETFGRYSLRVESPQGTGLQITDRMAGPGPVAGRAGEQDGRLDVFLDRGEYLVTTHGHRAASGDAALAVRPFAPASAEAPPRIEELKLVSSSLHDLEERSWWLDLAEPRRVALEAAGRSLADLRLWRDGRWLVDAAPESRVLQPKVGQPLVACRLVAELEAGLYLLTAYGGPPQPWAEESEAHPLFLRWGIPRLGSVGRRRHELSPFGIDRFRVPGSATDFRIELPEARPAELRVVAFAEERPYAESGERAVVEKESVPPVAELARPPAEADHVVIVSGEAGQPYLLQHFQRLEHYAFTGSRPHWVSTIHSGHAADSADATGVLIGIPPGGWSEHMAPLRLQAIELGPGDGWRRRLNLLATTTLHLRARETGRYTVSVTDAEARVRIEPFLVTPPPRYEPPPFRPSGEEWELDAGLYVVTLEPQRKGVAVVELRSAALLERLLERVGLESEVPEAAVAGAVRFEDVPLQRGWSYRLYVNRQPGVAVGAVIRSLPLDLSDPLPVWQRPGEEVAVPFRQAEAGTLTAETEEGDALELSLDGGPWGREARVVPGTHTARVRVAGDATRAYALGFVPDRLAPDTPLPELEPERLAQLPEFPKLAADAPVAFDLDRGRTATYLLETPEPGLYRIESTGLLATEGNLRTRTVTSLVRRAENGVGRNFAIQSFLTEGDYQLSVSPRGRSTGHLGLALTPTPLRRGGFLTLYRPARVSLPAGEAIEYRFIITEPGEFRIRALGSQGRRLRCRLDDREGWPIVPPEGDADLTRWFDPGHYRFVVLPEPTDARVVSVIEPAPRKRRYAGHGPHRLPLGREVESLWMEPEGDGPREPDVWELELPAEAELQLELGGEMRGRVLREDGSLAAEVPVRRGFRGRLERGRYRLEVTAARVNNRAPYALAARPVPLLAGLERELELPADVSVAVGETGLVELSSFGTQDVRARLYDADGALIAASDDRPDDWNFAIGRSLDAGEYRLRVEPVGRATGRTSVSMRRPALVEEEPVVLPAGIDLVAGDAARVYPLVFPAAGADLVLASARAAEGVGLALELRDGGAWRTAAVATGRHARLEVPLPADASLEGRYRLRLWSLDRRESPVRLSLASAAPAASSESRLAQGLGLEPVAGFASAAAVRLDRPGLLRASGGDDETLRWCPAVDAPCRTAREGLIAATGERLFVVADGAEGATAAARASRVVVRPGDEALAVPLPDRVPLLCDVAPGGGGPLLLRADALAGEPGIAPTDAGADPTAAMAVGRGASVGVSLRGDAAGARLWRAAPGATEVRLRATVFPSPRPVPLVTGKADGVLESGAAARVDLRGGEELVRLALDPALVAVLSRGERPLSVHWGGGAPLAEAVESAADRLTLLHAGEPEGPARFVVESLPLPGGPSPPLAPGAPVERALDRAGRLRLDVAPLPAGGTLHVRGTQGDAVLLDGAGQVRRGTDLDVAPGRGGVLWVPHAPGLVLAWSAPSGEGAGPWPASAEAAPVRVSPPASLELGGGLAGLEVDLSEPSVLHLRTAGAVGVRVAAAGADPLVEVYPAGARLDVYLPEGSARIALRGLGAALSGRAEVTTSAVTPLGEGLGPEVLLPPGASRFFSFRVDREGPVGIGVRAGEDVVEALLRDSRGALLGSGTAQMPRLAPGSYLLELEAPRDGRPVRARAAVVGLDPPDTGPPEEVVREYLERFAVKAQEEER